MRQTRHARGVPLRLLRGEHGANREAELLELRALRDQLQRQVDAYRGLPLASEPGPPAGPAPPDGALETAWAEVQRTHDAWRAAMDAWQGLTRQPPAAAPGAAAGRSGRAAGARASSA